MKKILLYGLLGIIAAAALVLVGYIYLQNANYKRFAMAEASKLTGTQVDCTGFTFNPFSKTLSIRNLRVGNPSKYNTLYAVQVGQSLVSFSELDLDQRQFLISEIRMEDIFVNYEADGMTESNLLDVLAHIGLTPSGNIGRLRVKSLAMGPASVSLNSVRYKREVGNVAAPGFSLDAVGGTEGLTARDFTAHLLRATLMHVVASIGRDTDAKVDPQFRLGANELLARLAAEFPALARDLKL